MDFFSHGSPLHQLATGTGLMAVFAVIAAGWSRVKSFGSYISSALVLHRRIEGRYMSRIVGKYIREHYKPLPSGSMIFTHVSAKIEGDALWSDVPFEMHGSAGVWRGPRGIFFVNVDGGLKLLSLRGFSDPKGLIADAIKTSNTRRNADYLKEAARASNFRVVPVMGTVGEAMSDLFKRDRSSEASTSVSPAPNSGGLKSEDDWWIDPDLRFDESFMYARDEYLKDQGRVDPFKGLFYPEEVYAMIETLKSWYNERTWYEEHNVPWRTGVLTEGPGGTGKSSLSKAVAMELGIPLYQYYLNTFNDRDFVTKWGEMETPCVVALEDFDTVFHGRECVTVHKSLSFECVLNQISGISSKSGILLMVTTNHIEHVDPALGRLDEQGRPTRPGRIDHILHMGNTTEKQRRDIANYTLNDTAPDMIEELVAANVDTTAAQFQAACIHVALERKAGFGRKNAGAENVVPLHRTGT